MAAYRVEKMTYIVQLSSRSMSHRRNVADGAQVGAQMKVMVHIVQRKDPEVSECTEYDTAPPNDDAWPSDGPTFWGWR